MNKRPCEICGKQIGTNGLAQYQHMMKHVREGKAHRELKDYGSPFLDRWEFVIIKPNEVLNG